MPCCNIHQVELPPSPSQALQRSTLLFLLDPAKPLQTAALDWAWELSKCQLMFGSSKNAFFTFSHFAFVNPSLAAGSCHAHAISAQYGTVEYRAVRGNPADSNNLRCKLCPIKHLPPSPWSTVPLLLDPTVQMQRETRLRMGTQQIDTIVWALTLSA